MKEPKGRHELKYELRPSEFLLMRPALQAVMQQDIHAGPDGGYSVQSLYFDNFNDKALFEKVNGVNIREKYRLRMYNRSRQMILFERKAKRGSLCYKSAARISEETCDALVSGNALPAYDLDNELLAGFTNTRRESCFVPKTMVSYDRTAFVYGPGNVRVTYDSNIRTGLAHASFFDDGYPLIPALPGSGILEIKYDGFLPDIIRMIVQTNFARQQAYSKYAACRRYD